MRVLVKIAEELRVYSVNAVYNLNSIDDDTSETSNRTVIECGDTDKTTLILPFTKEYGEKFISEIAKEGLADITNVNNIEVEASLIGCKGDTAGIDKLDVIEDSNKVEGFISFQDSEADEGDWNG